MIRTSKKSRVIHTATHGQFAKQVFSMYGYVIFDDFFSYSCMTVIQVNNVFLGLNGDESEYKDVRLMTNYMEFYNDLL